MAFLDDLKQGFSDVTKTVCEKSGQFVEIQRLRVKKNSLNSELKAVYAEIGKMVYEEKKAGMEFSGPVVQLCQKIDMGLEAIEEVDAQIEEAKAKSNVEDSDFDADDIFEEDVTDVTESTAETAEDEAGAQVEEAAVQAEEGADEETEDCMQQEEAEAAENVTEEAAVPDQGGAAESDEEEESEKTEKE